ncbi:hypothetical protein LXL04_017285 [Taraxacum kok-saghyz]
MLKLHYHVVSIVSRVLNDAPAKKYDLEAWFPTSKTYRELVWCLNYTDYLSRKLEIKYGHNKSNEQIKQYCYLLNSTFTPIQMTLCCMLDNYQREDGVEMPKVFMLFPQPRHLLLDQQNSLHHIKDTKMKEQ